MPDTITVDAEHIAALQEIAADHQRGPDSALGIFAATAKIPDRDRLADEIATAIDIVESSNLRYEDPHRYEQTVPEKLDALYELETWLETHQLYWGVGDHYAGYPSSSGAATYFADPDEALAHFVEFVQNVADVDDADAEDDLYIDDYDCGCGHGAGDHVEDGGCEDTECGCQGFQPDLGDEAPRMRAAVDKALADDPPQPGTDYTFTVEDHEDCERVFWLKAVVAEVDAAAGAVKS